MSNFSFSHSVYKRLVQQTRKNKGLFGKGLSPEKVVLLINKIQYFGLDLRPLADQKKNVVLIIIFIFDGEKNILPKKEKIQVSRVFSSFQAMFQKHNSGL